MTIDVRTTPALSAIRTWTREQIRDPDTEADGSTRPAAALGWSDVQVDRAINDAIIELQMEQVTRGYAAYLREATFEVTDGEGDLPDAVDGCPIESLRVELDDGRYILIIRGSHQAPREETVGEWPIFYRWSLKAQTGTGTSSYPAGRVVIEPQYTGTIQVRYWDPTQIPDDASDQHALMKLWGELVALYAARSLLSVDDDFTVQQEARLANKLELYFQFYRPRAKRIRKIPRR